MEKRSTFSGKLGFVLAAAGSAVGLGNIWRFPYLAAKYGGGIFLIIYILLAVTFGFSIMVAEIAIGRKTGKSPIGAFSALSKKFTFVGIIASVIAFLILPYYSVIGGWVLKYLITFISGNAAQTAGDAADTFFSSFIAQPVEPILWQAIFVIAAMVVVIKGVDKGIEKASKFLMPILVVLSIIIAIYSMTLPGAGEGIKYLFIPNMEHFSVKTIIAAMGQMFYSMSLAMGIMITYGSYLKKTDDLESSVKHIEIFDTGIAILAAMMIIPAVFAFSGGDPAALNKGAGLMFVTLPKVFNSMPFGAAAGAAFFVLVLFAALTSAISLMEAVVSTICDEWKIKRNTAVIIVTISAIIIGMPSSLGYGLWSEFKIFGLQILDQFDFLTNSVLMPIVALLTCIIVGYIVKPKVVIDEVKLSSKFKREKMFVIVTKYIAPVFLVLVLVSSVLDTLGIFKI